MLPVFLSQPAGIESFFPLYNKLPLTFITTSPVVHNLLQKQYKLSHLYFDTLEQCLDYIQKERSKILLTDASLSSHLSYEQTQEEIFQKWLQNNQSEGINIMVKPHPRENPNWMCNYNVNIVNLTSDDSIYNFIYFCDLVVGVNSTVLYVCFLGFCFSFCVRQNLKGLRQKFFKFFLKKHLTKKR